MPDFTFGSRHTSVVTKVWAIGNPIWRVGDLVEDGAIPGGVGIVEGVLMREKTVRTFGETTYRFTYEIGLS